MIRNPYAKRPRPTTPEISCQGPTATTYSQGQNAATSYHTPLLKGRNLIPAQQPSVSLLHHPEPFQSQQENSTRIPFVPTVGSHNHTRDWNGGELPPPPKLPNNNGGDDAIDPWDTCDIDWDAATQQLDQVSSQYQEKSQTQQPTTSATRLSPSFEESTSRTTTASGLIPNATLHPLSSSHVDLERPFTTVANHHPDVPPLKSVANELNGSQSTLPSISNVCHADSQGTALPSLRAAKEQIIDQSNNPNRPTSCPTLTTTTVDPHPNSSEIFSNAEAIASLRPAAWTSTTTEVDASVDRPVSSDSQRSESRTHGLPAALQFSPEQVRPVNDEYRDALVQNANLGAPLLNQWTLFPHQRKAILRALLMRRMILALDMGLGKTLIGCVWAKAFKATFERLKIFVICPVSLLKEWKRTAQEATGLDVQPDGGGKAAAASNETSLDLQICSWAKVPTQVSKAAKHFVVVCDESHAIQSMSSSRTKDTLRLVSMERCVGVLLLTGTPMKNGKPCNLFPLLRAVRHPFGANQKAFEIHFCAGHQKSFGPSRVVWDANGSSNLGVLREQVASHMLYMTKEQCLDDLPPQTRKCRQVPVSSRFQLQHNQALNDLAKLYASASNFQDSGTAILGAVQRVRMIASLAKIDATVGLAKEILQDEPAVVIFTSFQKVAGSVHQKLKDSGWHGELLTGETPAPKRQGMVDNFQSGLSPVFVCTFGAGGVGLTLTAACTVILLDRPWTPGDAHQAEDRVRRIGQTKPVTSIWMTAFDLDRQIDSLLEQKNKTSNTVLADQDDENKDTRMSEAPKISIFQMLKSILGNRPSTNKNSDHNPGS